MSRASWKGPFINLKYLSDITLAQKKTNKNLTISRNSQIVPNFLGLTFNVHNGRTYSEITITNNMIGHKFGEFVFTRATFVFKKKAKKKLITVKKIKKK